MFYTSIISSFDPLLQDQLEHEQVWQLSLLQHGIGHKTKAHHHLYTIIVLTAANITGRYISIHVASISNHHHVAWVMNVNIIRERTLAHFTINLHPDNKKRPIRIWVIAATQNHTLLERKSKNGNSCVAADPINSIFSAGAPNLLIPKKTQAAPSAMRSIPVTEPHNLPQSPQPQDLEEQEDIQINKINKI